MERGYQKERWKHFLQTVPNRCWSTLLLDVLIFRNDQGALKANSMTNVFWLLRQTNTLTFSQREGQTVIHLTCRRCLPQQLLHSHDRQPHETISYISAFFNKSTSQQVNTWPSAVIQTNISEDLESSISLQVSSGSRAALAGWQRTKCFPVRDPLGTLGMLHSHQYVKGY